MKAYKVVKVVGNKYYSAIVDCSSVATEYIPGQWVGPRVDGSRLLIFTDLISATEWCSHISDNDDATFELWICEVDKLIPIPYQHMIGGKGICSEKQVQDYWMYGYHQNPVQRNPKDSATCNYLKLLERV